METEQRKCPIQQICCHHPMSKYEIEQIKRERMNEHKSHSYCRIKQRPLSSDPYHYLLTKRFHHMVSFYKPVSKEKISN